ncbi:MAG: lysophospholipid acyltransferase family protein [Gordonia sp. (in: high G+C Gram-positive bacteria)]|uniref:lysophospholipid acyltransferase family protein n=1 Tax=Gordonia sp. (in: high G+C Gram-positive bacteria) TaxID=84139 RepID=UPI003C78FBEE
MTANIWVPSSPCGPHCVHTPANPATRLRAVVRAGTVISVGSIIAMVGLATLLLPRSARHRYWRGAAKVTLRLMGITLRIDDRRPTDGRRVHGALVVANHISLLDIVAVAAVTPARFVAKREVVQMAGFGPVARLFGVLPHIRGDLGRLRPMIDQVGRVLDSGQPVVVFPEGTTWCGTASGRFRPAFFQAAVDAGVPVLPISLRYTDAGHATTMPGFLGDDTVGTTMSRVLRSADLTITVTVFDLQLPAGSRAELAAAAQELIAPTVSSDDLRELAVDLAVPAPLREPGTTAA